MYDYVVRLDSRDHNGHMNNTRYGDIVLSLCDKEKTIKELEINFLNESLLGDTIAVYKKELDNYSKYAPNIYDRAYSSIAMALECAYRIKKGEKSNINLASSTRLLRMLTAQLPKSVAQQILKRVTVCLPMAER